MRRLTIPLVMAVFVGVAWISSAAAALPDTIFCDSFSNSTASNIAWAWRANNASMTFSNNTAVLTNPDTAFTAFLIHRPNPRPSRFTFSARFLDAPTVNGAGIMFCVTNGTYLTGYTLQLGSTQYLYSIKYTTNNPTTLIPGLSNSYINTGANTIAVSKSSDTVNVFVNGRYITRFNDTQYDSGDIAIVVPNSSHITVDNVVLTSRFLAGNTSSCFADSFRQTDLEGWNTNPWQGGYTVGSGKLVLNNTDTGFAGIIYANGSFQNSSIKAAIGGTRGSGMYGVCFISVIPGDSGRVSYKPYAFMVDSSRKYWIINPDSSSGASSRPSQNFILGGLGTDTLEVLRYATHFVFKVNGSDVGEVFSIPSNYRIDGAGFYVAKRTTAAANYFIVGGDSTGASCAGSLPVRQTNISHVLPQPHVFGTGSVVYDVLGRKVGVFDRLTFEKAHLVNGLYFVMPAKMNGAAARALRVLKVEK